MLSNDIVRRIRSAAAMIIMAGWSSQAFAQDEEWVRVDVFGGRASVEVPKSYKRVDAGSRDHFHDEASAREFFYREGMREAWVSEFNETRESYTFPMSFAKDSRAHFFVLEARSNCGDVPYRLRAYCSDDQDAAVYEKYVTFVTYHDRSRGTCFQGGIGGAAAWMLCKSVAEQWICMEATDYIEYFKARRWSDNAPATWRQAHRQARGHSSAKELRNRFWHMANGPVIKRVLESFRYK